MKLMAAVIKKNSSRQLFTAHENQTPTDTYSHRRLDFDSNTKVEILDENFMAHLLPEPDLFRGLPSEPPLTRQSHNKNLQWGNMLEENSSIEREKKRI
jgi:hypothetical protein